MAKKSEYKLAIEIAGMVEKSLGDACNLTKKELRSIAKEAAAANKESVSWLTAMENAGSGIDSLWGGATKVVKTTAEALLAAGAAAGVVGGLAINAGSDFESAFAGVIKTVDATDKQLDNIEEGLRSMAKNMPMTAVELAGIAEAAGQLGIATENIEDFTKTMADLSVATNLTSEEAASQFAKFANITGMSQTKFDRLGSSVVALGNNFATTEADIVNMAMRIAGAGNQVDMTDSQIMALSASLSSVGIEAEAGGSAVSTVISNIDKTVATNGKTLKTWAKTAAMTPKEFKEAWETDVTGTLQSVFKGMSDAKDGGENLNIMLDELGISSIRQTDMMKRMSGAADLFSEAVEVSNSAFEENTALTKEAEQRYQTFESRVTMVGNRINDAGISIYQSFRDPLSDILDMALEATDNMSFLDPKFMDDMAKGFQANIPTVVQHLGNAKDAFLEFASPFIAVGDWMIENPDVIAGTLAAIGTTITTLKLTKEIAGVTSAMKGLFAAMGSNPVTATIGVIALAGGAIVGVATKIKIANAELKKQKLAEAFGDITLSMSELQDTAKHILGEDTLKQFSVAMEEMGKISAFADEINRSADALRKLTWKIDMGMELNEIEQETFRTSIEDTIENSIALVEQAQYTVHLNVDALFGEGDAEGAKLLTGFDALYQGIHEQVTEKGLQLGAVYKNAMKDGIIDSREAQIIQELQAELGRITAQVAQSQLDAKLERIHFQYSGKDLDAETFQNLQNEIQEQLNETLVASDQSFDYALGSLNLQLERSKSGEISIGDTAYLTQAAYDKAKEKLENELLEKQMEIEMKGISFQTQTIADAFSDDLDTILPQMGGNLEHALRETLKYIDWSGNATAGWTYDQVAYWLDIDGLDKTTKAALGDLWKSMEPEFDNLMVLKRQYESSGKEIPESVQKGLTDAATIGMLAGSEEAMWVLLGDTAGESEEFKSVLEAMQENGAYIPKSVAEGIEENTIAMEQGVDKLHMATTEYLDSKFDTFTVTPKVKANFALIDPYGSTPASSVTKHAEGGIFDTPHYGVFAEAGPEAFIPLDGSQNAVSIWEEVGEYLGVLNKSANNSSGSTSEYGSTTQNRSESQIVFSPVFHVAAGNEAAIREVAEDAYQQFEQFMRQYQRTQQRLAF